MEVTRTTKLKEKILTLIFVVSEVVLLHIHFFFLYYFISINTLDNIKQKTVISLSKCLSLKRVYLFIVRSFCIKYVDGIRAYDPRWNRNPHGL